MLVSKFLPLLMALLAGGQRVEYLPDYGYNGGAYCSKLISTSKCCTGRQDDCSTPISTTRCYCDEFCSQHGPNRDCCPDYEATCGIGPGPIVGGKCLYAGRELTVGQQVRLDSCYVCTCTRASSYAHAEMKCVYNCHVIPTLPPGRECYHPKTRANYRIGETIRDDCKTCTCKMNYWGKMEMSCYPETCPTNNPQPYKCHYGSQYFDVGFRIRTGNRECVCQVTQWGTTQFVCDDDTDNLDIYERINRGNYGWKTYRYPFLVGKSLDEVYRQRTGVCRPVTMVINQNISVIGHSQLVRLPESFDARTNWPGKIHAISDQRDEPISWAISTAELASDRTAIHTNSRDAPKLSVQNLVACVLQPRHDCSSTTAGWEYVNRYGILTDQCYPRTTGLHSTHGSQCHLLMTEYQSTVNCPYYTNQGKLYRLPRQYKLSTDERFIQVEIMTNGPVQAHIRVKDDFFYYRSGVYSHVSGRLSRGQDDHFLAVRIIGWGVDRSEGKATKYWLCTNSWGTQWGENGYFRIRRDENECDVEAHVYGVWSKGGTPYYDGFIGGP